MLGHKTGFNRFEKADFIQNMFSNHYIIKLEINNSKTLEKFTNIWKLNNILLSNKWIKEEITRAIRKYFEMNKKEDTKYWNI